jgi:hypothetical protein
LLLAPGDDLRLEGCSAAYPKPQRTQTTLIPALVLSHYQLATKDGCMILKINFNIRIRYVSHFPLAQGDQLSIIARSLDPRINVGEAVTAREALRPPANNAAAIQSIVFETRAAQGPTLSLQFTHPMAFDVAPGKDFQSLLVALNDVGRKPCKAEDPFAADASETDVRSYGGETIAVRKPISRETVITRRPPAEQTAPLSPATSGWQTESEDLPRDPADAVGGDFREARKAMKQGDLAHAIQILKHTDGPDALELLGVAYQKNKTICAATALRVVQKASDSASPASRRPRPGLRKT